MDKIDIRDLRLGNWVYSSFSETPCKVTEIRLDESGYGVCRVTCVDGYKDVASLSPIPLTKEILEKNGFIRYGTNYALVEYNFSLSNPSNPSQYYDNYFVLVDRMGVNVKYVHQLQNILRDVGIEKEITI